MSARRYPLIAVPGGPQPPRTAAEKAAYDAGLDALPNPDPSDPRTTEVYEDACSMRVELDRERAHARNCNYDY